MVVVIILVIRFLKLAPNYELSLQPILMPLAYAVSWVS